MISGDADIERSEHCIIGKGLIAYGETSSNRQRTELFSLLSYSDLIYCYTPGEKSDEV